MFCRVRHSMGTSFSKKKNFITCFIACFFLNSKKVRFWVRHSMGMSSKKIFFITCFIVCFFSKNLFFFSKWVRIPKFGQSAPTPNTSLVGADCRDLTSMSKSRKFFYLVRDPMFGHSAPTQNTSPIGADCRDLTSMSKSPKFFYWVRDPMFGHSAPTPDTSLIGADC